MNDISRSTGIHIDFALAEPDADAVREELRSALTGHPRSIPAKYFYDDQGSILFEQITTLPEYYPTRAEAELLRQVAGRVVTVTGAHDLVELGAGAATKSRILLDAMKRTGQLVRYVPVDVSDGIMRRAANELIEEYPGLTVHGMVADFITDLGHLPDGSQRLVAFLGGTIGNLDPNGSAVDFLRHLHETMAPDDHLILGTDLIKDPAVIEAAYNDSQGVTAAFNRNILQVVNRDFGGDFVPEQFAHRAYFDRGRRWIEMHLVAQQRQDVRIDALDLAFTLEDGEAIRTEISTKFDRPRVERLFGKSGFQMVDWFTDAEARFALSLARPV